MKYKTLVGKFSLNFGLLFAIAGTIIGSYISSVDINHDYDNFYVYSGSAAIITATLFSLFLIERPQNFSTNRMVLAALLTGITSHIFCWFMIGIVTSFKELTEFDLFQILSAVWLSFVGSFIFSLWSWLFFGWATVTGAFLAIFLTKKLNQHK